MKKKQHFLKALICSLALCTVLSLCGCGESNSHNSQISSQSSTQALSNDDGSTAEKSNDESTSEESSEEKSSEEGYKDPKYTLGKIIASGECGDKGDNVTWELDEYGLLVISGNGDMDEYSYDKYDEDCDAPWYRLNDKVKTAIVKNGIIQIGGSAFAGCTKLTSITIPDSVTKIGKHAFEGTHIRKITIPDKIKIIEESAFSDCTSLESITIPDNVTSIGQGAFWGCTSLTSITIPNSVTNIEPYAFSSCYRLEEIHIDENNNDYISLDGVLYNKEKTLLICCPAGKSGNYSIPNGITTIGEGAFLGCMNLNSITIPDGVTNIEKNAFWDCHSISTLNIPDSVTSIGHFAFSECCNITKITIPTNVTYMGNSTFYKWTSSQTIYMEGKDLPPSGWENGWHWDCKANIVWNA